MIGTMTVKEAEAIEKAVTRSINDYNKNCIEYKIIDLLNDTSSSSSVLILILMYLKILDLDMS